MQKNNLANINAQYDQLRKEHDNLTFSFDMLRDRNTGIELTCNQKIQENVEMTEKVKNLKLHVSSLKKSESALMKETAYLKEELRKAKPDLKKSC